MEVSRMFLSVAIKVCISIVLVVTLESAFIRNWLAGIIADIWTVVSSFSSEQVLRGLAFWLMINLVLYVAVSVFVMWRCLWELSKKNLNDPDVDIPMTKIAWFWKALTDGPRVAAGWLRDGFAMDLFIAPKLNSDNKEARIESVRRMSIIINTYADMRYGVATGRLTMTIYVLSAISVILWGLYPFMRSVKLNIAATSQMALSTEAIMGGVNAIRK